MRRYSDSTWAIHIPLGFGVLKHNNKQLLANVPLLFALNLCFNYYTLILAVKQSISFGQFEPVYCLFKLLGEINHKTCS